MAIRGEGSAARASGRLYRDPGVRERELVDATSVIRSEHPATKLIGNFERHFLGNTREQALVPIGDDTGAKGAQGLRQTDHIRRVTHPRAPAGNANRTCCTGTSKIESPGVSWKLKPIPCMRIYSDGTGQAATNTEGLDKSDSILSAIVCDDRGRDADFRRSTSGSARSMASGLT